LQNIISKRIFKLALLGMIFIALLTLTVPGAVAQQAVMDPNTFYFATIQEPTTLDPAVVYDGSDRITRLTYESLLNYRGNTFEVEANLAESWEFSPDFKVYTFHLKEGVTFHDGTPFNAEAVKFSLTRMLRIGKGMAWAFKMVLGKWNETKIDILDTYTIRMTLKYPYPAFLTMMASRYAGPIISPSVMQHEVEGDLAQKWAYENTIGTGPYMLEKWTRKVEIVLVKNPNYWKGWEGKHVERVVMKIVPEASTQRLMLEQGEIDSATHITIDDLDALKSNPNIKVVETKGLSTFNFFVLMNTRKGLLQDIRLRQALSYAFDYEGTVNVVFKGLATQAIGPMPQSMPFHNKGVFVYDRDVDKAKELLADAGYPNGGFTLSIAYFAGQDWAMRILGVLTSNLGELGIKLEPVPLTWSAMMDKLVNQETAPDLNIADWWPDYPDADSFITGMCEYYFWGGRTDKDYLYFNSTLQDLLYAASSEVDTAKRQQMYYQAQDMLVQDAPGIWVLDLSLPVALRKEVQGYVYNAMYEMTYTVYNMWKQAPVTTATTATTTITPTAPVPAEQPALPMEYIAGIVLAIVIVVVAVAVYRKRRSKA